MHNTFSSCSFGNLINQSLQKKFPASHIVYDSVSTPLLSVLAGSFAMFNLNCYLFDIKALRIVLPVIYYPWYVVLVGYVGV